MIDIKCYCCARNEAVEYARVGFDFAEQEARERPRLGSLKCLISSILGDRSTGEDENSSVWKGNGGA